MAHIQRRKTSKGYSYKVRYTDPDGRERSRTFTKKALADDFLTSVDHSIRSGAYVDPSAGRITVAQYLEAWRLQQAHHRPKTAEGVRVRLKTMVNPFAFGQTPLAQVKPSTIRVWQKQLTEHEWKPGHTYARATIQVTRGIVAGAFRDAVLDRLISSSPFEGVKSIEPDKVRVVPRTVAQVRAAEAATVEQYRAVIPTVCGTGLRWAEVFGLTVDRVNFLRRVVTVDRQLAGRKDGQPVFGPPKTKAGYRDIPIAQITVDTIAAHLAKYPAGPGELIFRTSVGTPLTRTLWGKAWRPEGGGGPAVAMGLQPGEGLHHLRHFYASLLIADGRSVTEVQERLGHASAQETLDTYAHLWEGNEDGTRGAIERALGGHDEGDATQQGDAASSSE